MQIRWQALLTMALLAAPYTTAFADTYSDALQTFRANDKSGAMFKTAYGYAIFPTIGKGGAGIGGARGKGRVYEQDKYIGDSTMTQLTVGLQLGGQAYSQIIFFEDERSLKEFTSGNFEFGAQATAVAITAGASAQAGTTGTSMGASAGKNDSASVGRYNKGMAVFTIAKGGLMYEAAIGGQKFSFSPLK